MAKEIELKDPFENAILTAGKAIMEDLGLKLENLTLSDLGRAKKVKIDKDNTTIVEGAGKKKDIEGRVELLKNQIKATDSSYDKEKLQERLAKLSGGVAIIEVGATTETEMKERKSRVEDALHATRAAIEEGIVPGGGVALLRTEFVRTRNSGVLMIRNRIQQYVDIKKNGPPEDLWIEWVSSARILFTGVQ